MKIKINETEFYNIEMPEEISGEQLFGILERLRTLSGFFKRTIPNSTELEGNPFPKEKHWNKYYVPINDQLRKLYNIRENLVKLTRVYYLGSKEEKEKIKAKYGKHIFNRVSNEITKKKVLPSEAGMMKFRHRADGNMPIEEFSAPNKLSNFVYDNKIVDELLNL